MIFNIINFHLSDTVYKWSIGLDFADAISDSQAPEGVIVKTIMRLNMLMGNVKSVCRLMGNS
jgi:superfamily II RNA helicase